MTVIISRLRLSNKKADKDRKWQIQKIVEKVSNLIGDRSKQKRFRKFQNIS